MSTWHGFVDDLRPAGAEPLDSPYVGLRAALDTDLPDLPDLAAGASGVRVVLTGGAAQVAGPVGLCERRGLALRALDTTLRDPVDPAGNARRVAAALRDAPPPDGTRVHVRVPVESPPSGPGLAALDELATIEAVVALPVDAPALEPWLDAALDRELAVSLVGGTVEQAVDAVRVAARLWGDEGDDAVGRRFVVSWLTDDTARAVAHLEGPA